MREGPEPGTVHLWRVDDAAADRADALARHLSADELRRADALRSAAHRRRFVARRAALRLIVSRHLVCRPGEVSFRTGPWGKPEVDRPRHANFGFSVSQTDGLALLAFGRGPLGVDVERVRGDIDFARVGREVFTEHELLALEECTAAPAQSDCFYRIWTRKEACLKALGLGLGTHAREIDVLHGTWFGGGSADRELPWSCVDLSLAASYRGALALPAGTGMLLQMHSFIPEEHPG